MKNLLGYKIFHEISAGGVVVKRVSWHYFIAVIERTIYKDITLPKGHQKPGESLQITATREVLEETGFSTKLVNYLGRFTYLYKDDDKMTIIFKTVHWFLMNYRSGKPIKPNKEIDKVRWVDMKLAPGILTYKNDQKIVNSAEKLIETKS